MKIWLINPYGPIPTEAWRTYCYTLIADTLTTVGHDVIWWTSNFAHHFKKWRSDGWKDMKISDNFTIRLVPTPGYKNNISLGRVQRDVVFAARTYYRGIKEPRPDLIIFFESPLTFGYAGQKLAQFHKCPSIYHQMDLWPELIENTVRPQLRYLLKVLFQPVYYSRKKVFNSVSASTALATPYLNAVFKDAPDLSHRPHAVIYNGIDVVSLRNKMNHFSGSPGNLPSKGAEDVWAVFAGSLGPCYDIDTLCDASKMLKRSNSKIKIVVAGDGPKKAQVKNASNNPDCFNMLYLGTLSSDELAVLYSKCDIGLCAYSPSSNVEMPDKIYDYTAACLPVVISLTGEAADIALNRGIGVSYKAGCAENLVSKLNYIASDTNILHAMSRASMELGAEFDIHVQYSKLLTVIDGIETIHRDS